MTQLTVGAFLRNFVQMLHDLVTSKKVATAVATVLTAYMAHDPDLKKIAVAAGVALLLGQGAADFGKVAKLSPQPAAPAATPTVGPAPAAPASSTTDPPKAA